METDLVDLDRPGAMLAGRFRLERALGRGASAVVWEATHVLTGRVLALKVFGVSGDDRPGTDARKRRERLLREARAASRTQHPHVLPIDDVLELPDGRAALVMPRLFGESLRERLTREDKLLVEDVRRLFAPVVEALLSAHEAGVVHRDLKPDNLFVTRDPERLMILDFGIAKLIHDSDVGLTSTGVTVGTPLYMAPEQLFGEDDVDGRADAWALGVVLHECLSGVRPTEATNLGQLLKRISARTLRVLSVADLRRGDAEADTGEKDKLLVDRVNELLTIEAADRPTLDLVLATLRGDASRAARDGASDGDGDDDGDGAGAGAGAGRSEMGGVEGARADGDEQRAPTDARVEAADAPEEQAAPRARSRAARMGLLALTIAGGVGGGFLLSTRVSETLAPALVSASGSAGARADASSPASSSASVAPPPPLASMGDAALSPPEPDASAGAGASSSASASSSPARLFVGTPRTAASVVATTSPTTQASGGGAGAVGPARSARPAGSAPHIVEAAPF